MKPRVSVVPVDGHHPLNQTYNQGDTFLHRLLRLLHSHHHHRLTIQAFNDMVH
jgi:hypothetical protein